MLASWPRSLVRPAYRRRLCMRLTVTSVEDFVLILNGKQPSVNLVTRSMIRSNDGALRYLGEKCTKLRRKVLYMGVRLDTRPSDSLIACGKKCSGQRTNNSFARNRSLNGKCDRFIKIGSSPLVWLSAQCSLALHVEF